MWPWWRVLAVAVLLGAIVVPARASDHFNLENKIPITIEDIEPIDRGSIEFQAFGRFSRLSGRKNLGETEPRFVVGVFERTQLEIAAPLLLGQGAANGNGDTQISVLRKLRDSPREKRWTTSGPKNEVAVIDAKTYEVREKIPVGKEPAHVVLTPDGKMAYVTNEKDNSVSSIDIATMKVISTIAVGTGRHGLRPSPDGKEVYVADGMGTTLSVIEVATNKKIADVAVGKAPLQVAFSPDGKFVYFSLATEVVRVYSKRAARYNITAHLYYLMGVRVDCYRKRTVEALRLRFGDRVLDLACGTGANFPWLERAVGRQGHIFGLDLTPAMLNEARKGIAKYG